MLIPILYRIRSQIKNSELYKAHYESDDYMQAHILIGQISNPSWFLNKYMAFEIKEAARFAFKSMVTQ
jgi:hypothetical protein